MRFFQVDFMYPLLREAQPIPTREGAARCGAESVMIQVQQVSVNGTSSVVCTGRVCNPFQANNRTEHR